MKTIEPGPRNSPRYFFHTLDGHSLRDHEGEEMAGPDAAHREVLRILGEILRDGPATFWDKGEFSVLCTDREGGTVVGVTARRMTPDQAIDGLRRLERNPSAERP